MADCTPTPEDGQTIASALQALGPRTVEGDQGRVSMHGVHDAIAALEYERKRNINYGNALRTISNHRLGTHDGRGT